MKYKGTVTYIDEVDIPAYFVIEADRVIFFDFEAGIDGKEKVKHTIMLNTANPRYRTGTDVSGGNYEHIDIESDEFYYDWTINGNGRMEKKRISIRTWNRKEYFISGWQEQKPVGRGKHKYYNRSSSHASTIIHLNDDSASAFAAYLETVISANGK